MKRYAVQILTRYLAVLGVVGFLGASTVPGFAQAYPERRITFVVGYEAGGTGDVVARIITRGLGDVLSQVTVVENRAGASGSIAAQSVVRSTPDGYTILVGQSAEIAINKSFMGNLNYDAEKDLVPVALGGIVPLGLVVPASSPYTTLPELLKAANDPKGLLFASAGPGTPGHFAGELLKQKTNGNMVHVPYKGAGPALNDLLGSHADLYFSGLPAALPFVRGGQLRLLGVSSGQRASSTPETPTVAEAGNIPGFDITLWVGFFAPRGTPADVVAKLNQGINTVLAQAETKQRLGELGVEVRTLSPSEMSDFVKSETDKYAEIVKRGNLHR